jgi:hypothetical protein
MAHAFNPIPAKPAFGALTKDGYQSDYISNKKAKLFYCKEHNKVNCNKLTNVSSYNQYNLFYKGRYLNALDNGCILPFNKTDLIAGQYSKMDLKGVCTVINGSPCSNIDSCSGCATGAIINATTATKPFNQTNTIDPRGSLFGSTACGINNFTRYMVYSPPTKHY